MLAQARWRHLRSCAGALKSITWAYRTRVTPFEPDALHPNAEDDQAEQVLRAALVEWRQGLSAGADLNNTTLRKRFPESVFQHGQRQPPTAISWWQLCAKWFSFRSSKSCWTSAHRAWMKNQRASKAKMIFREQSKNSQCTAYCAPFPLPVCNPTQNTQTIA